MLFMSISSFSSDLHGWADTEWCVFKYIFIQKMKKITLQYENKLAFCLSVHPPSATPKSLTSTHFPSHLCLYFGFTQI